MFTGRINLLLKIFMMGMISFSFIGGDCSTNDEPDPQPNPTTVAAPGSITFSVDAIPGGNSYALINWTASPDENNSNFKGYRIITVSLNASGQIVSTFEERELPATPRSHQVLSINRGTRYKTFLVAELNDGTKSDSLETEIYSGVYYNNDGVIDSYTSGPSNAQSGFGWSSSTGAGTQYAYTAANDDVIDIHLRLLENELFFFSPDVFINNFRNTSFSLIGSGQSAFDETELQEPSTSLINAEQDNVYLIKTQENYYIKIWLKTIDPPSGSRTYYIIEFDYKVQSVEGLRIVKK